MTKERSQGLPRRNARTDNLPAVRDLTVGKYIFPPGAASLELAVPGAVIEGGALAECQITEPLLREFLALLEAIQEELNSRWNGQGNFGRHVDHARRAHSYES
ncbi:hypothetical protein [Streptomyces sp. NPDC054962]